VRNGHTVAKLFDGAVAEAAKRQSAVSAQIAEVLLSEMPILWMVEPGSAMP
jgi:hypothetical protein